MARRTITIVLLVCLMVGATLAPASAQQRSRRGGGLLEAQTAEVTGTTNRGGTFEGTFDLRRFVQRRGTAYALGVLRGTVNDDSLPGGSRNVRRMVRLPVTGAEGVASNSGGFTAQQEQCDILNLELGPLDLNLLGLVIQLDQVNLDIIAVPGAGNLLGNLLCAVAGLLDPGLGGGLGNLLQNLLQAIINLLNQLLGNL